MAISILCGVVAGVLGITGWVGMLIYLLGFALSVGLLLVSVKSNAARYFQHQSAVFTEAIFVSLTVRFSVALDCCD